MKSKLSKKQLAVLAVTVSMLGSGSVLAATNTEGTGSGVAIGAKSIATSSNAVALGSGANAAVGATVAVGGNSIADQPFAVAIGNSAKATAKLANAFGATAAASGLESIAIGNLAKSIGDYSVSFGPRSNANGYMGVALGYSAKANGYNGIALGAGSVASQSDTLAVGLAAKSNGIRSIALGSQTEVTINSKDGIAIGNDSYVGAISATKPTVTTPEAPPQDKDYTVDYEIGEKYEANPIDDTKGKNDNELYQNSIALGVHAKSFGFQTMALGPGSEAHDSNSIALGVAAIAKGNYSVAIGQQSRTAYDNTVAIGHYTEAKGEESTAVGYYAITSGVNNLALGNYARLQGVSNSVAVGSHARSLLNNSVVLGKDFIATPSSDYANDAYISGDTFDITTQGVVSVGNVAYSVGTGDNKTSIAANTRRIINVAGGYGDYDAVNVKQLRMALEGINIEAAEGVTVNRVGNKFTIGLNVVGTETPTDVVTVTPPPYNPTSATTTASDDTTTTPGESASGDTGNTTPITSEDGYPKSGTQVTIGVETKPVGIVDNAGNKTAVTPGGDFSIVGGDNITTTASAVTVNGTTVPKLEVALNKEITGLDKVSTNGLTVKDSSGNDTVVINGSNISMGDNYIHGVKAGVADTDAVNVAQLGDEIKKETRVSADGNYILKDNTAAQNITALDNQVQANSESINTLNNNVASLDNRVSKLDTRLDRVGAGAAALAALHPQDYDPSAKWGFAAGYGNYKGANAVALGAFYRPTNDLMFSVGTSMGGGENMFNAGVSIKIGSSNEYSNYSKSALAEVVSKQASTIDNLNSRVAKQEQENQELRAQIQEIMNQLANR
ncbi:MAG: YadA-like family protein [Veillonella sp.]|uniref:YadA-like family protein n=1 Tax=Veillonella sp. TaxID=1926307 RepID=UPI0025F6D634|nr:YadA-like family protein [Veillonella sp.]MBS4913981.1 YadA-like family protein [Veillonella sp.]